MSEEVDRKGMIPGGRGGLIKPPWDAEQAREMSRKGNEALRQKREALRLAALEGVRQAGKNIPGVAKFAEPEEVMQVLYEQHALNAYDPSARNAVASLREVRQVAYPEPEKVGSESGGDNDPLTGAHRAKLAALLDAAEQNPAFAARLAQLVAEREADE